MSWACSMCTFLNAPILTHCELCGTEREAGENLADVLSSYLYESGPNLSLKPLRPPILSKYEATTATEELLEFFDRDVNKLLSFVGSEMKERSERKQREQEYGLFNMFAPSAGGAGGAAAGNDWWASEWEEPAPRAYEAIDERGMDEILAEIEAYELDAAMKESLKLEAEMVSMQEGRRRQSMMVLQKRLSEAPGADGRRMSRLEAKNEILQSAVEIAALEEQEDMVLETEQGQVEEEEEEGPEFKFLPYVPVEGDEIDLAVANLLNGQEIDLHVQRPAEKMKKKTNSRTYKVSGVAYTVRHIHGMTIAKKEDESKWGELGPMLRQIFEASK